MWGELQGVDQGDREMADSAGELEASDEVRIAPAFFPHKFNSTASGVGRRNG